MNVLTPHEQDFMASLKGVDIELLEEALYFGSDGADENYFDITNGQWTKVLKLAIGG